MVNCVNCAQSVTSLLLNLPEALVSNLQFFYARFTLQRQLVVSSEIHSELFTNLGHANRS